MACGVSMEILVMNVVLCAVVMVSGMAADAGFDSAKPVWPEGRETEKNLFVGFRAVVEPPAGKPVMLRVTGSTRYRAFVNGGFIAHGPAAAAHGFYRVDEWDISDHIKPGANVVAIEVAGYNANSYYLLDQPSFLQAEVVSGGTMLASTGGEGAQFEASVLAERVQKVQRFSFQRPFIEVYRLTPEHDAWHVDPAATFAPAPCAVLPLKVLLPRRVPYPRFAVRPAKRQVASGIVQPGAQPDRKWSDRSLKGIGPDLGGYPEAELEVIPTAELITMGSTVSEEVNAPMGPEAALELAENEFGIVDLGTNLSGFLGATVSCDAPCRVMFVFDEILSGGDVNFTRMGCVNTVTYEIPAGTYALESFEPYTMRYVKVINLKGNCAVSNVQLRDYTNSDVWEAQFACSDDRLNRLFDAGRETFRQNAVDVFMDCPSRERAGWLCDSFFTARTAFCLSGDTAVETNFIENFLLPDSFAHLPEGMLPMCYPSDHYNGNFIPNWAMWFVVELEEYVERSGDLAMAEALKPRLMALFKYFEGFKNSDGLLESLEQWVFVEWSAANKFVQDVNYPTNMLFAQALDVAGRLYTMEELSAEAAQIRKTILEQSFDGTFFVDNAKRKDGVLSVTQNRTEVCQYFAFFFGVASSESHPELWRKLHEDFGPDRKDSGAHKEVHPANAFVGNMLRFELLSRYGLCQQILDESIEYLLYMADRTGTLWENVDERASCNHGFASHIVHTLYRDVLGLAEVDAVNKQVTLRFTDLSLDWCEGRRPLPDGALAMRWRKDGEAIRYTVDVPAGYAVTVENLSGKELVREP
jgi:alpha-L-rhamnosidase